MRINKCVAFKIIVQSTHQLYRMIRHWSRAYGYAFEQICVYFASQSTTYLTFFALSDKIVDVEINYTNRLFKNEMFGITWSRFRSRISSTDAPSSSSMRPRVLKPETNVIRNFERILTKLFFTFEQI